MALTHGASPAHSPHVPAWKRIGLKLKYAKDTPEPTSTIQQPNPLDSTPAKETTSSTATHSNHTEDGRPSKKRKTSSKSHHATQSASESSANDTPSGRQSIVGAASPNTVEPATRISVETEPLTSAQEPAKTDTSEDQAQAQAQPPSRSKRRKSVTFTGETKQTDGNSAKSFTDPTPETNTWNAALPTSEPTTSKEAPTKIAKKTKKEPIVQDNNIKATSKKERKTKASISQPATAEKPEYVRYLELFQQDKTSWKFNKNHQTALLKNLFDLRTVPASLTPAVVDYISGLQGAGPRERLIEETTSILRTFAEKNSSLDEIDAMNTELGRREAYFRAMTRYVKIMEDAGMPESEYDNDQLEEMNTEIEKGKRAEAVLRALPLSEPRTQPATSSTQASSLEVSRGSSSAGQSLSSPQTTNTSISQPKTATRKRKRRTDASSDSSSSDSDSSSSDSEDETATTKGPTSVAAAIRHAPEAPPKVKPAPSRTPTHQHDRTPAYQHDNLNMAYRPQNASQLFNANVKPTKKFFDDDLLDAAFPKEKTYNEVAPKRRKKEKEAKARGFAYTHGTRVDESGSEDDD